MASITSIIQGGGFSCGGALSLFTARPRRMVVVRAEVINPDIKKNESKVVHTVDVTQLSQPVTSYCRCWRSGDFPLCDGSHVKHNKETGDNIGPLEVKKK